MEDDTSNGTKEHFLKNRETIEGLDAIVIPLSHRPSVNLLNLVKAGVQQYKGGYIKTKTSVNGIYAEGDIVSKVALTLTAIAAG